MKTKIYNTIVATTATLDSDHPDYDVATPTSELFTDRNEAINRIVAAMRDNMNNVVSLCTDFEIVATGNDTDLSMEFNFGGMDSDECDEESKANRLLAEFYSKISEAMKKDENVLVDCIIHDNTLYHDLYSINTHQLAVTIKA